MVGAHHILNSSSPNFIKDLTAKCKELDTKYAIDPIGGEMTSILSQCLNKGS